MSAPLLEVSSLLMRFQGLTALDQVSFSIERGSVTSLIGPNGAGKTTLFNCVTGMYTPSGGAVHFEGEDITGMPAAAEQAALEVLAFLGMEDAAQLMPAELPYGRQKQVEFARALMQKARLIMLDEPMAGMSSAEKAAMTALIQRVRAQYGITFLIVEHDIPVIMDISDKIVVLDFGRKIAEGPPLAVQNNPEVIAASLGTGH